MKALAILVLLAGAAAADPPDTSRLGYRIGIGGLPLDGHDTFVFSLGLGLEQPLAGRVRAIAEYDVLWTERRDGLDPMAPPEYGTGHRIQLGARRVLAAKRLHTLRLWLDGELGGGAMLVTDNLRGVRALPDGFVGLRAGYDLRGRNRESPSRTFTAELLVRAIAIDRGIGLMGGVGMAWGN